MELRSAKNYQEWRGYSLVCAVDQLDCAATGHLLGTPAQMNGPQ
jgi:hypothetical protein